MDMGNMKISGLSETDRVLNTRTATRVIPFPDGIDRSFTLLGRQWLIFDVWQLQQEDPAMIATGAYEIAQRLAVEFERGPEFFEADLREAFENIIETGAVVVEMPGETVGGNDNLPGS